MTSPKKPRHGAVGVVVESGKFLVIRRSLTVKAPGLLFQAEPLNKEKRRSRRWCENLKRS